MLDNFRFETFVDVHSNIFAEYLSSVIAKLPKENPEYHFIEERIEELYKEYPKVMGALDTEKPRDLSEQECKAYVIWTILFVDSCMWIYSQYAGGCSVYVSSG